MAPYVPEEVDVFTIPHSRMKDLVNDYVEMLQTTNFSDSADLKLLLDSLSETFKEFKLHEQIENNLIMKRLKNKLKALSIRNSLVCNCHKDTHLTDMLMLVQEGFDKRDQQDRLNYSLQLKKSLEEFTEDFIPHMKQEEEIFQPMLLEYFSYEELCELKRKVIDYHSRLAAEVTEKGLIEEAEKELGVAFEDDEEDDGCGEENIQEEKDAEIKEKAEIVDPTPAATVSDLPPEVMNQVFSYLDPQQVTRCRQVCTLWNEMALDPHLWTEIHPTRWADEEWKFRMREVDYELEEEEREGSIDEEEDEGYTVIDDDADIDESEPADNERDSDQTGFSKKVHRQAEILLGLVKYVLPSVGHSVKVLNLGHCHALTNGLLQRLLKLTPNVEYLNLAGTRITDSGLKGLGKNWCGAKISHMNLSGCGNITDTTLERLSNALSGQLVGPITQRKLCWCEEQRQALVKQTADPVPNEEPLCAIADNNDVFAPNDVVAIGLNNNELKDEAEDKKYYLIPPPSDEDYSDKTISRCSDACHAQCNGNHDCPEPDPIEDCARPVFLAAGYVNSGNLLPPVDERTRLVAVPPDQSWVDCVNNIKTAACPKGQLFVEDVFEAQDRKPQKPLSYLNLSGCYQLTDYGISSLAAAGPLLHLTHLDLSGCLSMTGDGLRLLVDACPALNHDTLFYCDNILDGPYAETASGCQNIFCGRRVCCRK